MAEPRYIFGAFELFPERRLLLESGAPIKIGPRAFDLLAILADRGGQVVSQSDLKRAGWPHATVDDVALRVHLSSLRKALQPGNGGHSPIANISGRGYSLTIPCRRVEEADAPTRYPTPREVSGGRTLPAVGKRLVGRDAVVAALIERLQDVRLLSIVGPGGIGKTSVAIAVAAEASAEYEDGVAFVDLAVMADPNLLWSGIASAAGIETVSEHISSAVAAGLSNRKFLVILDNCEHLIEAAASAAQILWSEIPSLHILATSREPLRAEAEHVHRLPPLAFPDESATPSVDDIASFPALQLLIDRAKAQHDGFQLDHADLADATAICRKLDGLPLAIELVASGVAALGVRAVAAHLQDRHAIVMKGSRTAPPRHRTLEAVLDWSYEALPETEKTVLKQLAIFRGAVDFDIASTFLVHCGVAMDEAVEALYALRAKSLLSADLGKSNVEYRLLETTKLYAIAKLKADGRHDDLSRKHAQFFCEYFADAEEDWNRLSQADWRFQYGRPLAELRSALDWAMCADGDLALAASLLATTGPLWTELGIVAEYRDRLDAVLAPSDEGTVLDHAVLVRLKLEWAKSVWLTKGPTKRMIEVARASLATAERLVIPVDEMEALWLLWDHRTVFGAGENSVANKAHRILAASSDPVVQLAGLRLLAIDLHYDGDQEAAWQHHMRIDSFPKETFREIRRICHRGDQSLGHITLGSRILWMRGFPDQATDRVSTGLDYARNLNDMSLVYFLGFAACPIALWCGDVVRAEEFISELDRLATLHSLAFWGGLARGYRLALPLLGKSPEAPAGRALPPNADGTFLLNQLELFSTIHPDLASPSVLAVCETKQAGWGLAEALRVKAIGLPLEIAEPLLIRAVELARRQGALSWELRATATLAEELANVGRIPEAASRLRAVYARFTEGFETQDLFRARALLARLDDAG